MFISLSLLFGRSVEQVQCIVCFKTFDPYACYRCFPNLGVDDLYCFLIHVNKSQDRTYVLSASFDVFAGHLLIA